MKNMKNSVMFMPVVALVFLSMVNMVNMVNMVSMDTHRNMIEMLDEENIKCSTENMNKLSLIYMEDDTNDLIEAYKATRVYDSNYAAQIICMVGYEVDGYYFYRSYMMTSKTWDTTAVEVTDVSMKWHCIKFEKIEDCYEWNYA